MRDADVMLFPKIGGPALIDFLLTFNATMDPHSTHSRFNHRAPKSGPMSRNQESLLAQKPEPVRLPPRKASSKASKEASANLFLRRPIATNSRVKQDELFKRDMYLSFVSNALQQKTTVRACLSPAATRPMNFN